MKIVNKIEDLVIPEKHHKFFRDDSFEKLTWEDVIDNLDRTVSEDLHYKSRDNYGIVTHDTRDILKIYPVLNKIKETLPDVEITTHLYASLTSVSKTFGKHNDVMDVVIWQCIGITNWTIYDDEVFNYRLKPGEFLYIPKEMYHNTSPVTPRASVSFGIEHFRNEVFDWK